MKGLRRLVPCLPLLALACGSATGETPRDAGAPIDGPADFTFVPSNLPASALAVDPPGDLIIGAAGCEGRSDVTIDTDARALPECAAFVEGVHFRFLAITQREGGEAALLVTRSFQIEAGMRVSVRGRAPLVLLARGRADIGGSLGATALGASPAAGGSPPQPAGMASGGGAGGSYCGSGGSGGPRSSGGANAPGPRHGDARIVPLAGGSSGGSAGTWEGGAGGGALQIVAGQRIAVSPTGVIHAGGGGGDREGCGGGSGGAILLEAPVVIIGGVVAANGGGGGSGGLEGADATPDDRPAAGGGAVNLNTGEGGSGAAGTSIDGSDGRPNPDFVNGDFSGGGGGGAGFIRINGEATVTGTLSPALGTACASTAPLN
jgi:hypothetical protein